MDEEKLKRAVGLLKEASDMLFSVEKIDKSFIKKNTTCSYKLNYLRYIHHV